jgi:hypothetical protein
MALPTTADLTRAKSQRDGALREAHGAQRMVKDALASLVPAQRQAESGWADMKKTHRVLTAKKLFGKGRRPRALLSIFLPEISKAYMAAYKRAPNAIAVINEVVKGLHGVKRELDASVVALETINIPASPTDVASLSTVPGQVATAQAAAMEAIAKADQMLSHCDRYQKKSVPFIKATVHLLGKVHALTSRRLDRLKDRKLVIIAKEDRIKALQKVTSATARFQKKLSKAEDQISSFVKTCPSSRKQISNAGAKISAISMPGMPSPSSRMGDARDILQKISIQGTPAQGRVSGGFFGGNGGVIGTLGLMAVIAAAAHISDRPPAAGLVAPC